MLQQNAFISESSRQSVFENISVAWNTSVPQQGLLKVLQGDLSIYYTQQCESIWNFVLVSFIVKSNYSMGFRDLKFPKYLFASTTKKQWPHGLVQILDKLIQGSVIMLPIKAED
jgi:hypothetical protein